MTLRGKTYWADFRSGGQRVRKSLSANLKTAKQLLIELRARAERGDFGLLDNDVAVQVLRDQFLKHCRQTLKPRSLLRYTLALDTIVPHLPPRVSQLSIPAVMTFRESRSATGTSPGTVNYEVLVLKIMLSWAASDGVRMIGSNPLKGLKRLPHDHPRDGRALDDAEVNALLEISSPRWRDIFYTYLVTGFRKTELTDLTFDDVDWDARELVIRGSVAKNHKSRRIPIDDGLWEILCRQREARGGQGRVFLSRTGKRLTSSGETFLGCCRRAGIETRRIDADGHEVDHVSLHSLRKTFATNLITHRTDPKTVQELLGHATLEMTLKLYTKINVGNKRQAIARLTYGAGVTTPEHLVEFPGQRPDPGHKMPTTKKTAKSG